MKRLFLFLLLFCSAATFAQETTLPGFLQIPWDTGIDEIKTRMGTRSGIVYDTSEVKNNGVTLYLFKNGSFFSQDVKRWFFYVHERYGMYMAGVLFSLHVGNYPTFRDDLLEAIKEKYGESVNTEFKDDNQIMITRWIFLKENEPKIEDQLTFIANGKEMEISLFYIHEETRIMIEPETPIAEEQKEQKPIEPEKKVEDVKDRSEDL